MTHDTDALVSELKLKINLAAILLAYEIEHDLALPNFEKLSDALEAHVNANLSRLTREIAEAREERDVYAKQAGELAAVATDHGIRMEQAEAERDKARAELAEWAQFIVWHKPEHFVDHACKECVTEDRVVFPGGEDFVCAYHKAKALLEQSEEGRDVLRRALKTEA